MIPHSWKLCLAMALLSIQKVSSCAFKELERIDETCTAQIDCQNDMDIDLQDWNCIRHVRRQNYYYGRREPAVTYDSVYYLKVNIDEPDENEVFKTNSYHSFIIALNLKNGNLITIPGEIYYMSRLKEINVSGNKINTVNFNSFLQSSKLSKIDLSHNSISDIIMSEDEQSSEEESATQSGVDTIDLSHNSIKVLPNSFLSKYENLQNLNLSHNMIDTIGILTFEGNVQLQTLDLSYNRLSEIGHALARFSNLKKLSLENNNISKLIDFNFVTLTNLEYLNISSNAIVEIEKNTFISLAKLHILDLGHNYIETIHNEFFSNNPNLHSVSLMNNRIKLIEPNTFQNQNISHFRIENNQITGALNKEIFKGIHVNELNLSSGNLTNIENGAFNEMAHLKILNISSNTINNISDLSFSTLVSLYVLDLSHNQLTELVFDSASLKNLTELYVHHNKIEKINSKFFENLSSLTELDLSFNIIKEIEPKTFSKLNGLKFLNLTCSNFVNNLEPKTFEGLISLKKLEMSGTRTTRFRNESFTGLNALTHIHSPFGQLANVEYNAYFGAHSLEIITLNNNQLRYFHVNTSTISKVKDINLSNNFIQNVTNQTFTGLSLLQILNLANNDIVKLDSDVFRHVSTLLYIDLSYNGNMIIDGNPFYNITQLHKLSLHNVKTKLSFKGSNATIEILDLQSNRIRDINHMYIYNVKGLAYLNMSRNDITAIDKDSFGQMSSLVSLDLSSNKIMSMQPGSFKHVPELRKLNLYDNNLPAVQFGVFDDLNTLFELNLASNVLSSFHLKLAPHVRILYLDDNIITHLEFKDFFKGNVNKLSIGGNEISCQVLAELKDSDFSEQFKNIVTAKTLNFHSENVDGVSCQNILSDKSITRPVSNNSTVNMSPFLSMLRNAIDKFGQSVQNIVSEYNNKTEILNMETKNVTKSMELFLKSSKESQSTNNNFLSRLIDINNNTNIQLWEIQGFLKKITDTRSNVRVDEESNNKLSKDGQDYKNMRLEFENIIRHENDALREEFQVALSGISKTGVSQQSLVSNEVHSSDPGSSKIVFYFIAICLAILVVVYLSNIVLGHVKSYRRSQNGYSRNSATTSCNSIEME